MTERLANLSPAAKRALLARALQYKAQEPTLAPLSFHQQQLWLRNQLLPETPLDTLCYTLHVTGVLRVDVTQRVIQTIVQRHEVLRTTFRVVDDVPMQVIAPVLPVSFQVEDLGDLTPDEQELAILQRLHAASCRTFDLTTGPLLRVLVLRRSYDDHVFCLTMHHLVADGWSMQVFVHELGILYNAFAHEQPSPLPALPLQYQDYARWQRQHLQGEVLQHLLTYWTTQLQDAPPGLHLPIARPRATRHSHQGALLPLTVAPDLLHALKAFSREAGVTLFMTMFAAFSVLLHRLSGQEDLLIGTPIAAREHPGTQGLIGFFVNVLVLRASLAGDPPFLELLQRVRVMILDALTHHELPFETLVEALHPARDASQFVLKQVAFNLLPALPERLERPGLIVQGALFDNAMADLDLMLSLWEGSETLSGYFRYHTEAFDAPTVARLVAQLQTLLHSIVAHPEQRLSALALLPASELQQLLVMGQAPQTPTLPQVAGVHALVEAQVARTPHAVALITATHTPTYQELNQRANRLAHHLRALGVGPEERVGLCSERSSAMVIGLLAILKAGGAYVPLDPSLPTARLASMLADVRPAVLLTQQHLVPRLPALSCPLVDLETDHEDPDTDCSSGVQAQHLAYVLYTSGSSGVPKGVMIEHRSVVNVVTSFVDTYHLTATDRVLQQASLSFDVSVNEIFPILTVGGALVLPQPEDLATDETFLALLARQQITVLGAIPAVLARWNALHAPLPHVRLILSGGETLAWRDVERLCQTTMVTNGYGPTEGTVCATCYDLRQYDPTRQTTMPIGTPLAHMQVYIVDRHLTCVPIGVAGELCLSGVGVARGYWQDAALTAEKFVPHPYQPGERLYRTGDLARWLPDGNIEFLGRLDHQIKLRGVRIEVEEIEAVLRPHPALHDVAVRLWHEPPGAPRLIAYVIPTTPQAATFLDDLRRLVSVHLPTFMRPTVFMCLEHLPRLATGKVDRRSLPAPPPLQDDPARNPVAPSTPLEHTLVRLWEDILQQQPIGVNEDFFALGGHSLLAVQLMGRIQDALHVEAPGTLLFDAPTIAQLARRLEPAAPHHAEASVSTVALSPLVPLQVRVAQPTLFCIHPVGGQIYWYTHLAAHLASSWAVYGLRSCALAAPATEHPTLPALALVYTQAMQQHDPHGPYVLLGFLGGGVRLSTGGGAGATRGADPECDAHRYLCRPGRVRRPGACDVERSPLYAA